MIDWGWRVGSPTDEIHIDGPHLSSRLTVSVCHCMSGFFDAVTAHRALRAYLHQRVLN